MRIHHQCSLLVLQENCPADCVLYRTAACDEMSELRLTVSERVLDVPPLQASFVSKWEKQ